MGYIFGYNKNEIADYIKNEAILLDVRTQREWDTGHLENAIHIPLSELKKRTNEFKLLQKPVIVCCASGIRSAKAAKYLALQNIDAINGGRWTSLQKRL